MTDMKLVVVGAAGRMGQSLIRAIEEVPGAVLSGAVERSGVDAIGKDSGELAGLRANDTLITDDAQTAFGQADGVLDFTAPAASVAFAKLAAATNLVHVIGTTGCTEEDEAAFDGAASSARIIKSGNYSLGVNLLAVLVKQAAKALSAADYDIDVLEMHHKHKVDAPSGTAFLLGEAAAEGRDITLTENAV